MADLRPLDRATSVKCPVANVFIRAAEYIRAWSAVKKLKDIDVVYLIMHEWSPDERDSFDLFVRTKAFKMGADLMRSNYVFDWNEVEDTVFVPRTINSLLAIYVDIKTEISRSRLAAKETLLVVSGREYLLYGRDEGSAKLLYSILSLAVSSEQIVELRDMMLGNGVLSRIALDDNYKEKFYKSTTALFTKIVYFVDFFSVYVSDVDLCFAASILLFEVEFVPEVLNEFKDNVPSVKKLMLIEIEMENLLVYDEKKHPSLKNLYYAENKFTDPWLAIPDFDKVLPVLEAPLVENDYVPDKPFIHLVNASADAMVDYWHDVLNSKTELFGANLLAATTDFSADYVFGDVRSYCHEFRDTVGDPAKVFLYGSNSESKFSSLSCDDSVSLNVLSLDVVPYGLRADSNCVRHRTGISFTNALLDAASTATLIIDFASSSYKTTDRASYRIPDTLHGDMSKALTLFHQFYGKPAAEDSMAFHNRLPYIMVMRFNPFHDKQTLKMRSELRRIHHHYVLRYLQPIDYGGLSFTIHCVKRGKPLPKVHSPVTDPLNVFDAFVYHSNANRLAFLLLVKKNRISWRMFGPFRMLSRYHGYGSYSGTYKVQDMLKFNEWGNGAVINDYNNMFGECDSAEIFTRKTTALNIMTKKRSKNIKKSGIDVGKSVLLAKNEAVNDFFQRTVNPVKMVDSSINKKKNAILPLFKKEKMLKSSEAFPI